MKRQRVYSSEVKQLLFQVFHQVISPSLWNMRLGSNSKRPFENKKKSTTYNSNNMCTSCGCKPRSSRPCPALSKKCNTCEKLGHFSKICRSKPPPNWGNYYKRNNFWEEENVSSERASPQSERGLFYTNEQICIMSAKWEYISKNNCKVKSRYKMCR